MIKLEDFVPGKLYEFVGRTNRTVVRPVAYFLECGGLYVFLRFNPDWGMSPPMVLDFLAPSGIVVTTNFWNDEWERARAR